MYLNHPLIAKLHQELATSEIGEVRSIQGSYVAAIDQFVDPESKGASYNLGCYPMSLIHLADVVKMAISASRQQ